MDIPAMNGMQSHLRRTHSSTGCDNEGDSTASPRRASLRIRQLPRKREVTWHRLLYVVLMVGIVFCCLDVLYIVRYVWPEKHGKRGSKSSRKKDNAIPPIIRKDEEVDDGFKPPSDGDDVAAPRKRADIFANPEENLQIAKREQLEKLQDKADDIVEFTKKADGAANNQKVEERPPADTADNVAKAYKAEEGEIVKLPDNFFEAPGKAGEGELVKLPDNFFDAPDKAAEGELVKLPDNIVEVLGKAADNNNNNPVRPVENIPVKPLDMSRALPAQNGVLDFPDQPEENNPEDNVAEAAEENAEAPEQPKKGPAEQEQEEEAEEDSDESKDVESDNVLTKGKEPLLALLREAKIEVDDEIIRRLPTWDQVTAMYGEEPVVYGLEQCERFQKSGEAAEHFISTAGTFNTGTNLMAELLIHNCHMPARMAKYGRKNRGVRWQVLWGKHTPVGDEDFRVNHRIYKEDTLEANNIFPVVTVRDPFKWLQSMCRHHYAAHWHYNVTHCPNLLPNEEDLINFPQFLKPGIPVPVFVHYKEFNRHHPSLIHFWNEWYNEYIHAPFPKLIVRFEDAIFHPKQITRIACECGGGRLNPGHFRYEVESSKRGKAHGNEKTGYVDALIKYGTEKGRYDGFEPADLEFAVQHLDPDLMKFFGYKFPTMRNGTAGKFLMTT